MSSFFYPPKLATRDVILPGMQLVPNALSAASLKNLTLRHSQFSPASLATLLGRRNVLKGFNTTIIVILMSCIDLLTIAWTTEKLRDGLRCVAGTLKHLSLALDFHYLEDYKEDD